MVYGLWQSAAGLQTQEYRQAILANNLANVDTPGFKPARITFQERLSAAMIDASPRTRHPVLDRLPGGLFESPVYTDFRQGAIETAQGPLDVAINGDGFLTVRTPEGPRYTRDGRLVVDRAGNLLHGASGAPVVDGRGQPIQLDLSALDQVKINTRGQIYQGSDLVAQLSLVDFSDRQKLTKQGDNLLDAGGMKPGGASGSITQYAFESSGVDPVASLVEMIEATRIYEMNANILTMQDESLGRAVSEVGRIG